MEGYSPGPGRVKARRPWPALPRLRGLQEAACTSRGIGLQGGGASSARGLVRNNVISGGVCSVNMGIGETSAAADPAVLENNDIWTSSGASVLYRDEQFNDLTTIAAVNALIDITAAANVSADPMLADTVGHLMSGSPARNAGTCTEAPAFDFERDPRPQELVCDIGRDELVP